jgi:hypothetical protein
LPNASQFKQIATIAPALFLANQIQSFIDKFSPVSRQPSAISFQEK